MGLLTVRPQACALSGTVRLSGAKNSALKLLAASVLARSTMVLENMPLSMRDIKVKLAMLKALGARLTFPAPGTVTIDWPDAGPAQEVPPVLGSVRTSLLLLGALLARRGFARVPLPGGCRIGQRCHDLHFFALGRLGAHCQSVDGYLEVRGRKLAGAEITFPFRTTGGTENAILAATAACGQTLIRNAHTRPEVLDLLGLLRAMGADVEHLGSGLIRVRGGRELSGARYRCQSDGLEAMTLTAAALLTGGSVCIEGFPAQHLEIPMIYLRESGAVFRQEEEGMRVEVQTPLTPFDITTSTYPGINSDMQPLFAVLALAANGPSRIVETRFLERFQYLAQLQAMGADLSVEEATITVSGPCELRGAEVRATDLRGGAALILAALRARGDTRIADIEEVDRGYERLDDKLRTLGADMSRAAVHES